MSWGGFSGIANTITSTSNVYILNTASTATTAQTCYPNPYVQQQQIAQYQQQAAQYQQSQFNQIYGQQQAFQQYVGPALAPNRRLTLNEYYELPDGSKIHIDDKGNYRVEDIDAKVIYQASRIREFNPYINASDLLEHFINDVGQIDGVDQSEVLRLPIEAFINWLILQAAQRDGDRLDNLPSVESALPAPLPALPAPKSIRPRCETCGRFIRKVWAQARIAFCSPEHMQLKLAQL